MKKILLLLVLVALPGISPATVQMHNLLLNDQELVNNCKVSGFGKEAQLEAFKSFIVAVWHNQISTVDYQGCKISDEVPRILITLRSRGRLIRERWAENLRTLNELATFINRVKDALPVTVMGNINSIELFLSHSYETKDYSDPRQRNSLRANIHRGIKGLEIRYGDIIKRYSPTAAIRLNRKHSKFIDRFAKEFDISLNDFVNKASFKMFKGAHLLIYLDKTPRIYHLHRGNQVVKQEDVTQASTQAWADLASDFLVNSIEADGKLRFKYWPSKRRYSGENVLRQVMATVALGRIAQATGRQDAWDAGERNINYNNKVYYKKEGDFGLIEDRNGVKLGALAQAALALIEHKKRHLWQEQEQALLHTVNSLWHDDGSFDTFYRPKSRIGDNINFYTGEALLTMVALYRQNKDPKLLDKLMKSYEYYKHWHFNPRNRNPAFIPWHTRPFYKVWEITRDKDLQDYIFTMNDWLIDQMQSESHLYQDTVGRFYKARNRYGPPHASATGSYMEGLIDAYKLAKKVGDKNRENKYRRSMLRGIRSLMQLQYVDETDMYYIREEERYRLVGAIKEAVYSNMIRSDNTQHGLMAILKLLKEFSEEDFIW